VQVEVFEQALAQGLVGTSLEQHVVVRQDDGCPARASRIVMMCCTKFNCLFEVVTTKSCRSMASSSRDSRPSAPIVARAHLRPDGGFDKTTDQRRPGSARTCRAAHR
jgi:hypothetical protein